MLNDSIAVFFAAEQFPKNGDQFFKYRQNSDLYYFSGLVQEQSIIVLHNDKISGDLIEYAFIVEPDEKMLIWTGHKYSIAEAQEISGIKNVSYLHDFDKIMSELVQKTCNVYYSFNSNTRGINYKNRFVEEWKDKITEQKKNLNFHDLDSFVMQLRLQKQDKEIATMQSAIDITGKTFDKIREFVKPNIYEYEVEA